MRGLQLMMSRRIVPRVIVTAVLALVLSGCGESTAPMPQPTTKRPDVPPPTPALPPAADIPHAHPSPARLARSLGAHPGEGDPRRCSCIAALDVDGWCEHHQLGFVAGHPVRYAQLFETLDPHGHEIGLDSIACERCLEAIPENGRCPTCHIGWFRGLAYMTDLTWLLAQGQRSGWPGPCSACRDRSDQERGLDPRWCATCNGGFVGSVFFPKQQIFEDARRAFAILRSATGEAPRCELCACAMVYDGMCPDCRITYAEGQPAHSDAN
jgi:hypothetical protein